MQTIIKLSGASRWMSVVTCVLLVSCRKKWCHRMQSSSSSQLMRVQNWLIKFELLRMQVTVSRPKWNFKIPYFRLKTEVINRADAKQLKKEVQKRNYCLIALDFTFDDIKPTLKQARAFHIYDFFWKWQNL